MSFVATERDGAVATIRLDRPERLNAISGDLLRDLQAALDRAVANSEVSVILLCGQGRAFCAGDDLKEFDLQSRDDASIAQHVEAIQAITRRLMLSDKIVVGAIHGFAVGGGFEWLLNCDLVVAADDLVAFFPEMDWGQFVTGGVTHLLPLAVGYQRAMELFLLGERQSAADLHRLGLVNRVVPREQMLAEAMRLAQMVASKSAASVGALKRLINVRLSSAIETALELEQEETIRAFKRPEAAERVKRFATRKEA